MLQGFGTAMVYPVLIAAVSDVAHPEWRASSLGVYRLWRDLGYAAGALLAGLIADSLGMGAAIHSVAVLTMLSGLVVALRMYETLPSKRGNSKRHESIHQMREQYTQSRLGDPDAQATCLRCPQLD